MGVRLSPEVPISWPWERITRDDVLAGRVGDETLPNGVVVPAMARVNCTTLREHQDRLRNTPWRPLNADEARALGYGEDEIRAYCRD